MYRHGEKLTGAVQVASYTRGEAMAETGSEKEMKRSRVLFSLSSPPAVAMSYTEASLKALTVVKLKVNSLTLFLLVSLSVV